jgi:hypothetical protein
MSKGTACTCEGTKDDRMNFWRIIQFKCNHSAFNGNKETASDYSSFRCIRCGHVWRSKSDYVYTVKARFDPGKFDPWERYSEPNPDTTP